MNQEDKTAHAPRGPRSGTRIRAARPGDREEIMRFSRNTWEWGDYIHLVWDRWFNEREGKLLVATIDHRPAATGHMVLAARGEAWLEGLRVDPVYRRTGLAMQMTRRCVEEARKIGAEVVRFATVTDNVPVHHVASRLRFSRVASYYSLQADQLAVSGPDLLLPSMADLPSIMAFLAGSPTLSAANGLYSTGWRFHKLNASDVKEKVEKGMLRIVGDYKEIGALSILEPGYDGAGLAVSYADGHYERLVELAAALRNEAMSCASARIGARLPEGTTAYHAFVEAGFMVIDPGPFWIYERSLESRSTSASET